MEPSEAPIFSAACSTGIETRLRWFGGQEPCVETAGGFSAGDIAVLQRAIRHLSYLVRLFSGDAPVTVEL